MEYKLKIGEKDLIFDTRDMAEQANGEVLVRLGDTMILVTAVMSPQDSDNLDFFPLTVDYEERYYAAGKILGARYIKRESRPADEAILTGRLVDRAIRPRFPENMKRAVQVIITCLSWDTQNDSDILGLLGASFSLSMSDIPWQGPLAAIRLAKINEQFIPNPNYEERSKAELDLVITGVEENGQLLINMIEARADEVSEAVFLQAAKAAEPYLKQIIEFQRKIKDEIGEKKIELAGAQQDRELEKEIAKFIGDKLEKIIFNREKPNFGVESRREKTERGIEMDDLKQAVIYFVEEKYPAGEKTKMAKQFFEKTIKDIVQENILKNNRRPDGRAMDEIRSLNCEVGLLPRTHGSGVFKRGQTRTISILTLGAPGDQQVIEGMEFVGKKRFMHHYNFPPYSVGEIKPLRGPGRRDIGHGMLAEKALVPLIPTFEDFPYTIRVVSETVSSNGSSSMASVSSSSLALMDAGVPIKRPAAGIAVGIVQAENGDYKLLTDIQGPEDHHGGMDFKVAGTRNGITAVQMDVKIAGITIDIMREALEQGRKAREQILDTIEQTLAGPRPELSPYAPRILMLSINPEKIKDVIGPGGRIIKEIIEKCGVTIDVQNDGLVLITSESVESAQKALDWVKNLTREIKVGEIFEGKVVRIMDFGAFVELIPGQDGLVHISELAPFRVKTVDQVLKLGQAITVKVIAIDEQGRINLSLKQVKQPEA